MVYPLPSYEALDDHLGQLAQQPALTGQFQPARAGPLGKLPQDLLIGRRQLHRLPALLLAGRHVSHWCLLRLRSYTDEITVPPQSSVCRDSGSVPARSLSVAAPPLELADVLEADAAALDAVTPCHTPPEALMPLPLACPGGGVGGVGVQRMAIVGGLGRAVGQGDRAELADDARPGRRGRLHRWPELGAAAVAVRLGAGVWHEPVHGEALGAGQHGHAAVRDGRARVAWARLAGAWETRPGSRWGRRSRAVMSCWVICTRGAPGSCGRAGLGR